MSSGKSTGSTKPASSAKRLDQSTMMDSLNDPQIQIAVGIAALVVLLTTIVLFVLRRKSKGAGNNVVLVGLSDSGKTQMFAELIGVRNAETFTSMAESVLPDFVASGGRARCTLVDVPGSEKVRGNILTKYSTAGLQGCVFVIDSASFTKEAKDVAEYLYHILANTKERVLIACNKQDLPLAKASSAIKTSLEKEFGFLDRSRAAALDSTEGATQRVVLGAKALSHDRVTFVECSAVRKNGDVDANLGAVQSWLGQLK